MIPLDQSRNEIARWRILRVLREAMPTPCSDDLIRSVIDSGDLDATTKSVRAAIVYLSSRGLLTYAAERGGHWVVSISADGVDVAEYVAPSPPGIARPPQ